MSLEPLELGLAVFADGLRLLLEGLSVATVLLGLLNVFANAGRNRRRAATASRQRNDLSGIRIGFGSWLCLALEFQLGADIVATTASPSRDHLIQLAVVAVIRTVLNVFLGRELAAEQRPLGDGASAGALP